MRTCLGLLAVFVLMLPLSSYASELGDLPTDQQGFQNKLNAFMVPGSSLKLATDLLERNDFRCFDNTALGQTFYCVRRLGGAMGSTETVHEVWLEYSSDRKITSVLSGVTVVPGVTK